MTQSQSPLPNHPLLFEFFPALRDAVPWTPLVHAPTPVERLQRAGDALGVELWIKRDDLTSPVYGGNKPRKLEFLLGDALKKGKRAVFTSGAIGTNHGLATAAFARQLGIQAKLGLFPQPVDEKVRKNLLTLGGVGGRLHLTGSMVGMALRCQFPARFLQPGTYYIPAGGSNALGALGFVNAGLELARQVESGEIPEPSRIYVAAGTCGTWSGLVLGLKLAGLQSRVIGVRVTPAFVASRAIAMKLARRSLDLLRRASDQVPRVELSPGDFVMEHSQFGQGYGHPTEDGRHSLELLKSDEGIQLELTYTGKAFGALRQDALRGLTEGPLLFWNTFSSADVTALAPNARWQDLPPEFHHFFQ